MCGLSTVATSFRNVLLFKLHGNTTTKWSTIDSHFNVIIGEFTWCLTIIYCVRESNRKLSLLFAPLSLGGSSFSDGLYFDYMSFIWMTMIMSLARSTDKIMRCKRTGWPCFVTRRGMDEDDWVYDWIYCISILFSVYFKKYLIYNGSCYYGTDIKFIVCPEQYRCIWNATWWTFFWRSGLSCQYAQVACHWESFPTPGTHFAWFDLIKTRRSILKPYNSPRHPILILNKENGHWRAPLNMEPRNSDENGCSQTIASK